MAFSQRQHLLNSISIKLEKEVIYECNLFACDSCHFQLVTNRSAVVDVLPRLRDNFVNISSFRT